MISLKKYRVCGVKVSPTAIVIFSGSFWREAAIEVPIIYGKHLREWHARSDRIGGIIAGKLAWEDKKAGTKHRLFQCRWENPKPEVEVLKIDFVSAMTDCFPFLIAITAE